MSWYEFEQYIEELRKQLENEAKQRESEERKAKKSSPSKNIFNSIGSQLSKLYRRRT